MYVNTYSTLASRALKWGAWGTGGLYSCYISLWRYSELDIYCLQMYNEVVELSVTALKVSWSSFYAAECKLCVLRSTVNWPKNNDQTYSPYQSNLALLLSWLILQLLQKTSFSPITDSTSSAVCGPPIETQGLWSFYNRVPLRYEQRLTEAQPTYSNEYAIVRWRIFRYWTKIHSKNFKLEYTKFLQKTNNLNLPCCFTWRMNAGFQQAKTRLISSKISNATLRKLAVKLFPLYPLSQTRPLQIFVLRINSFAKSNSRDNCAQCCRIQY